MVIKPWPAHASSLAHRRSALAPRPQSPFREDTMQSFVLLSLWLAKAWPVHASSLALGRSALAPRPQSIFQEDTMQSFAVLSLWLAKYSLPMRPVSHLAEAPSPLVLKAPFERIRCRASRFFRYGRQSMACPFVFVSHTTGAPSPLVLSAPFKRKRRKASRFFRRVRPQKNAKPLSDLRLSQRKISAGRAAFNRAF